MDLITVDELNEYTGNKEVMTLKGTLVEAASRVVADYLGYDPAIASHTYQFVGNGQRIVYLPMPIVSIASFSIEGTNLTEADYRVNDRQILLLNGKCCRRGAVVVIVYSGGLFDASVATPVVPGIIKHACLRIAALMLEEANGNIGISSKAFADMSKTFINYTDYDKYLKPLASLRTEVV